LSHLEERLPTLTEAVAGAHKPYSLIAIFGRGHLVIKAGGAVYVMFIHVSYVITSAGSPVHCNDVPPPKDTS
jgi:hypothetical protein